MTDLNDLANRIETEAPSRELDAEVAIQKGWTVHAGDNWIGPCGEITVPRFTTSVDAALSLGPRNALLVTLSDIAGDGLPGAAFVLDTSTSPVVEYWGFALCGSDIPIEHQRAQAITSAALRATAGDKS